MRKFDSRGLELAQFQGKIFEKSINRYECSSLVFLRRFKNSYYALNSASYNILIDTEYAFEELDKQYGKCEYGNKKFNADAMFWLGYIYRYIAYTREISTKKTFNLIGPKELIQYYYVYHDYLIKYYFLKELHYYLHLHIFLNHSCLNNFNF